MTYSVTLNNFTVVIVWKRKVSMTAASRPALFVPSSLWAWSITVVVSLLPVCDVSPRSVQSLSGTRRVLLILLESCQQTDVNVIALVSRRRCQIIGVVASVSRHRCQSIESWGRKDIL